MATTVYMCIEHKHWLENLTEKQGIDYHRHPGLFFVEVLSLLVIMVVANLFNVSALIGILRLGTLKTNMGYILTLNLTIVDLMASACSMPFSFLDLFLTGYLICYPSLCKIQAILALVSGFGNFFAVILISVYRCLRIVASKKVIITRKHVALMLACAWFFTGLFIIPPVWGSTSETFYSLGTHHCSPTATGASCIYQGLVFLFIYGVTIPTMVVCYGLITKEVNRSARKLMKHRRGKYSLHDKRDVEGASVPGNDNAAPTETSLSVLSSGNDYAGASYGRNSSDVTTARSYEVYSDQRDRSDERRKRSKKRHYAQNKVALTGALLILTTVICWTPYLMIHWCTLHVTPSHALEVFTMWLAYTNAALDPIIYTAFNRKIRSAIIRPVCWSTCSH